MKKCCHFTPLVFLLLAWILSLLKPADGVDSANNNSNNNNNNNNHVTTPSAAVYTTVSAGALQGYSLTVQSDDGGGPSAAADSGGGGENAGGQKFCVFKRVPIAEPPTGALRFAPLRPHRPWSGIRSAGGPDVEGDAEETAQNQEHENVTIVADESCFRQRGPRCAVLLRLDYSATRPLDARLGDRIVLVDAPIRRGVFGWLNFDAEASDERKRGAVPPKNLAIHDALYVLRWVNAEIANFGGDPGQVTLAGVGPVTGSIVAVLLALRQPSPPSIQRTSDDLFAQAIVVDASPQLADDANRAFTTALVHQANCAVNLTAPNFVPLRTIEQLECLRGLSATRLVELQREVETRLYVDTFPTGFDRCEMLTAHSYADMLADIKEKNIWISTTDADVNGFAEATAAAPQTVRVEVECQSAETIFGYTAQSVHDACVHRVAAGRAASPLRTARTAVAALVALANTRRGGTSYLSVLVSGTEAESDDSDEPIEEYTFNGNQLLNRFVRAGRPDSTRFPPADEWSRGFLAVGVNNAEDNSPGVAVGHFVNGYADLDALRFWLYDAPRAKKRSNADKESRSTARPPWAQPRPPIRCRHCRRGAPTQSTHTLAPPITTAEAFEPPPSTPSSSTKNPHKRRGRPSSASTLREWWRRLADSWRNRRTGLHDGEASDLRKRNGNEQWAGNDDDDLPAWLSAPLDNDGAKRRGWPPKRTVESGKHNGGEELSHSDNPSSERWWNDAAEKKSWRKRVVDNDPRTRQRVTNAKRKVEKEKARLRSRVAEKRREVNETVERRGRKRITERMGRHHDTWKEANNPWKRITSTATESPHSSEDEQSGEGKEDGSWKTFLKRLKESWNHRHEQIYGEPNTKKVEDGNDDNSKQEEDVEAVAKRIGDYKEKLKTKMDKVEAKAEEKQKAASARLAEGVEKVREGVEDAKQGRRNTAASHIALSLAEANEDSGDGEDEERPFNERWWKEVKDSWSRRHEQVYGSPNVTKPDSTELRKKASDLKEKLKQKMEALEAKAKEKQKVAKEAVDNARKTIGEGLEKVREKVEEAKRRWEDVVVDATTTSAAVSGDADVDDEAGQPFFKRWWDDVKTSWNHRQEQVYGNRKSVPENGDGARNRNVNGRQRNTVLAPFSVLLAAPPSPVKNSSSRSDAAPGERAAAPQLKPQEQQQEHSIAGPPPPMLRRISQPQSTPIVNSMSSVVWIALLVVLLVALAVFATVWLRSACQPSGHQYAYMATDDGFFGDERTRILGESGGGKRRIASAPTVHQTSAVPKYVVFD